MALSSKEMTSATVKTFEGFNGQDFRAEALSSSVPLLWKHGADGWGLQQDTVKQLLDVFGETKTTVRFGKRSNQSNDAAETYWESECFYEKISLPEFLAWNRAELDGKRVGKRQALLLSPCDYWAYVDYKYLHDISDDPKVLPSTLVDWQRLGFGAGGEAESVFWIGSKGCFTPLHYDTYGFNIVVQVSGEKSWMLFPPADTVNLYPTRIPFEESSVFSQVNVLAPHFDRFPRYRNSKPLTCTLTKGDVLYVPPKWWHFVQSESALTVSVNRWFPSSSEETDARERVNEAVTRTLLAALQQSEHTHQGCDASVSDWLNPTEEFWPYHECLVVLDSVLRELKRKTEQKTAQLQEECEQPTKKAKTQTAEESAVHTEHERTQRSPRGGSLSMLAKALARAVTNPKIVDMLAQELLGKTE